MLTYNQENFISKTIESVLAQKTDFPFQLVIGEDGSKDSTAKICRDFAERNQDRIKLISSGKNIGLIQNFIRTYKACDGDYVAILDGDDYWTDPLKLQKQVDFLEAHPDHSIVFTGFKKLYQDGRLISKDYRDIPQETSFKEMIFRNYICSATVMFRNKAHVNDFPGWIDRFPYGDWPLYLWRTRQGKKIGFLKEETAVYRMEIGVSEKLKTTHSELVQVNLEILECVHKDPDFNNYIPEIKKSLRNHRMELMAAYLREKKHGMFLPFFIKMFFRYPVAALRTTAYVFKRMHQRN